MTFLQLFPLLVLVSDSRSLPVRRTSVGQELIAPRSKSRKSTRVCIASVPKSAQKIKATAHGGYPASFSLSLSLRLFSGSRAPFTKDWKKKTLILMKHFPSGTGERRQSEWMPPRPSQPSLVGGALRAWKVKWRLVRTGRAICFFANSRETRNPSVHGARCTVRMYRRWKRCICNALFLFIPFAACLPFRKTRKYRKKWPHSSSNTAAEGELSTLFDPGCTTPLNTKTSVGECMCLFRALCQRKGPKPAPGRKGERCKSSKRN